MSKPIPSYDLLMNPLLQAMFSLGGSGSINEIVEKVIELENIPEEISSIPHNPEKGNDTELEYRHAGARTYLKKYGFLENSSRGIWVLTSKATKEKTVDPRDVVKEIRAKDLERKKSKQQNESQTEEIDEEDSPDEETSWREDLYQILIKDMKLIVK